jgi:hypothetical protein
MGNTCELDAQINYTQSTLPGSRLRNAKQVKNMPKPSFAHQVIQPELHPKV